MSLVGMLFVILQAIWGEIIENIVMGFFMWLSVATNFAETFIPGVLPVKLMVLGISSLTGIAALSEDGCL